MKEVFTDGEGKAHTREDFTEYADRLWALGQAIAYLGEDEDKTGLELTGETFGRMIIEWAEPLGEMLRVARLEFPEGDGGEVGVELEG